MNYATSQRENICMESGNVAAALDAFIAKAKSEGVGDVDLVALLRRSGWSDRRIYQRLNVHYERALGLPVPSRGATGESARDAFVYLLNFITLGFWTVALGNLLYVLIGRQFPDYRFPRDFESLSSSIAWQLATVITALPVFVYINAVINRDLLRRPDFSESGVRLWLTYIALIVAAIIVLMDGIWFLSAFLRGEITTRFVLDTLVLLLIGGGVFSYYFSGLRPRHD